MPSGGAHVTHSLGASKQATIDSKCLCASGWTHGWKPEEVEFLRSMGNIRARALYEATTPETVVRPTAASPDREVAQWIKAKYEGRRYYSATQPAVVTAPALAATRVAPTTKELALSSGGM